MNKNLKFKVLIPALCIGILGSTYLGKLVKNKLMQRMYGDHPTIVETIPVEISIEGKQKVLNVPVYDENSVPENHCSKYARLAAKSLFDLTYSPADAWNRKYCDKVVAKLSEKNSLEELVKEGTLKQGMIVGIYNPKSLYNFSRDQSGNPIEYTHVALYLGTNLTKELVLVHKYGKKTEVLSAREIKERGLVPKYVFSPKQN